MCECEFKDRCTSHPSWCGTCGRNKAKRNFYVPIPYPVNPYVWPYVTWITNITTGITTGNCQSGNYYQSQTI